MELEAKFFSKRRVARLSGIALTCVLILCGMWRMNQDGAKASPQVELRQQEQQRGNILTSAGDECVQSLTQTLEQGDSRWQSLFTDFPLSPKLKVWEEQSDGTSKNLNKEELIADMKKKYSKSRGRVYELARLLTRRHKRIPIGDRHLIVLEDNSVVSVNTKSCEVDDVYFNRRRDVHPKVRDAVAAHIQVAQDSGGSSGPQTVDEKLDQNCNDNGGAKTAIARRLGGWSGNETMVRPDRRNWCQHMVTYAWSCQLKGIACFVWDGQQCSRFGGSDTNAPCPTGHCCNIKNCPLVGDHACKKSPFAEETFDATVVIDNTLAVVDIAVTVLEGVLNVLDKAPVVGAVFGVFNSILGLFGNLAMTPEAALNEAKQYTDELVAEVYECMDHEFARSWTHHIRVHVEDVQDAIAGAEDLASPLQRIHQSWEPAAQACGSIGNQYRMFMMEYNREGNANLLIGQTPGALQICAAVFMEYMVDAARDTTRGYDPAKVRDDMKRMIFDLDLFMKDGIVQLDEYYRSNTVCGSLNLVTDKMSYLSQNLFLPSMALSSPILGGRVYQSVVLRFVNVRVSNPPSEFINLGSSNSDAESCKRACLDDPKCMTGRYRSGSRSCVGYKTALAYGSTILSGGSDSVYVVKERGGNTMVVGDTQSTNKVNDASQCLSSCQSQSSCYGSRFTSSCQRNYEGSDVDYVIFRNALVVEFPNYEWTGTKPTPSTSSIGKCLYECAKKGTSCVALGYDGVHRKCYQYLSSMRSYPGTTFTLDERDPAMQLRHFDIHYRTSVRLRQPLLVDKNVYSCPGINIARGKPTAQKTTSVDRVSSRAVDGNTDGNWNSNSCTHTTNTYKPWWYVDLQARYDICSVTLTNRADCCADRLSNWIIFVTDRKPTVGHNFYPYDSEKCTSDPGSFRGTKRFTCGKDVRMVGRYVGVLIESTGNILTLCEVQVRGRLIN